MDPLLIVSPHLDDAVLSCGQLMAGRPECIVASVFAGAPPRPEIQTTYDRACGFANAGDAIAARHREDTSALVELGATARRLAYPDHQYREVELLHVDPVDIAADLAALVDTEGVSMAIGPLGLAHPDHELTAEAFRLLHSMRRGLEVWLYEDLPSRVLWPDQVPARLAWWRDVAGYNPTLSFAGTGPLAAKRRAISRYGSQVDQLRTVCGGNLHPVLVPERHHRLWRCDP